MNETVLIAVSKWAVKNLKVSESLKSIGTELLEKVLWVPLKSKILKYFDTEKQADEFLEEISEQEAKAIEKPYRDVEDIYENIKGEIPDMELFNTISRFFEENQDLIKEINGSSEMERSNADIYIQKADKIFNARIMHIDKIE